MERRDGAGVRRGALLPFVIVSAMFAGACQYSGSNTAGGTATPTSPTAPTPPAAPADPAAPATPAPAGLTYTTDIAPIMNTDCVPCHGPVRHDAGYNLATYAGVMRAVTAGSANSLLVRVTQSNGVMYRQLSGNRVQKAQAIRDWVVTWKAQQ